MSRVTVLLPFVPEIETTGIASVGVADPGGRRAPGGAIRSDQRARRRSWRAGEVRGPRRRHVPLDQGQRGIGERRGRVPRRATGR